MSIKILKKEKYVEIDTDQDLFEGKSLYQQNKIAKKYILNNFRDKGLIIENKKINVNNRTATKYTNPKENIKAYNKSIKNRISTELDNLLKISKKLKYEEDKKNHSFAKNGWEYYETIFKINNEYFRGIINIGLNNNNRTLYDITNIKKTSAIGKVDKSTVDLVGTSSKR